MVRLLLIFIVVSSLLLAACSNERFGRKALRASNDIQNGVNSFTRVLVDAQKDGLLTADVTLKFKPLLTKITDINQQLNESAIVWANTPDPLPASAKQTALNYLDQILSQIADADVLSLAQVKNPTTLHSLQLLIQTLRTTVNGLKVLVANHFNDIINDTKEAIAYAT